MDSVCHDSGGHGNHCRRGLPPHSRTAPHNLRDGTQLAVSTASIGQFKEAAGRQTSPILRLCVLRIVKIGKRLPFGIVRSRNNNSDG